MGELLTLIDAREKFQQILAKWEIQHEEFEEKAFHFVQSELIVSYEQLFKQFNFMQPIVEKNCSKIAVIRIGDGYIVKEILKYSEKLHLRQLERQLRTQIQKDSWPLYSNSTVIYRFYIILVQQIYSKKAALQIVNAVTRKLLKVNKKSIALKEMHLFYISYLFSVEDSDVQREMKLFERRWSAGQWALREKEQVLFHYIRMHLAARRKRWQNVKLHAERLLRSDLLASYAVELTVSFGVLLPSYSTDAAVFIKPFKNHYVAYTCYLYVKALDQLEEYETVVQFMKAEPIVSCEMLYTYFRTRNVDDLVRVEAVVQQNIGMLVDGHYRSVRASIERWENSPLRSSEQIVTLSEHMCRLIKACFITGELEVFEKLMTIYMKYFYIERHFISLKERLQSNISYKNLVSI